MWRSLSSMTGELTSQLGAITREVIDATVDENGVAIPPSDEPQSTVALSIPMEIEERLEEKVAKLEHELENQREAALAEIELLKSSHISELESKRAENEAVLAEVKSEMDRQLLSRQEEIAQLEIKIQEHESVANLGKSKISELIKENESTKDAIAEIQSRFESLTTDKARLDASNAELITKLRQSVSELQYQIDGKLLEAGADQKLHAEVSTLRVQLAERDMHAQSLEDQVRQMNEKCAKYEQEVAKLQGTVEDIGKQLDESEQQATAAISHVKDHAKTLLHEREKELKDLHQRELEEVKSASENIQNELARVREEGVNEAGARQAWLSMVGGSLGIEPGSANQDVIRDAVEDLLKRYSSIQTDNERLVQKLMDLEATRADWSGSQFAFEEVRGELEGKLSETQEANEKLRVKLDEAVLRESNLAKEKETLLRSQREIEWKVQGDYQEEMAELHRELRAKRQDEENLKDEITELSADVQRRGRIESDLRLQIETLSADISKLKNEVKKYSQIEKQSESEVRRQLYEQAQTHQRDIEELEEQLGGSQKELKRLRQHLVEMEERHTEETLSMQHQIESLNEELSDSRVSFETSLSNLQTKLDADQVELGPLREQLQDKENECLELGESLRNLERVLEDFHLQQESLSNLEILKLKKDVMEAVANRDEAISKRNEIERAMEKMQSREVLVEELESATTKQYQQLSQLRDHIIMLQNEIKVKDLKIRSEEYLVDRRLVVNLLVKYILGGPKKTEMLEVLSKILDFNEKQKQQVGLTRSGWFSWGGGAAQEEDDKSIGDLWVQFLLKEAGEEIQLPSSSVSNFT